jgi:hypothetical protein
MKCKTSSHYRNAPRPRTALTIPTAIVGRTRHPGGDRVGGRAYARRPPTPPYVRFRIRRFMRTLSSLVVSHQRDETQAIEVGLGERRMHVVRQVTAPCRAHRKKGPASGAFQLHESAVGDLKQRPPSIANSSAVSPHRWRE